MIPDFVLEESKPTEAESALIKAIVADATSRCVGQRRIVGLEVIARLTVEAIISLTTSSMRQGELPSIDILQAYIEGLIERELRSVAKEALRGGHA